MARNRTIYNVQDVFFGLASGEKNYPEAAGYEILKRIHRVQSVSYDINTNRTDVGLLGKSSLDDSVVAGPSDVTFSLSYYMEGLINEKKMGFNVLTSGYSTNPNKEFTYKFLNKNKEQNIYVAIKKEGSDLRGGTHDPSEIPLLIAGNSGWALASPHASGFGVMAIQNCYADSYAFDVTVGNYPKVDINFIGDNIIYYDSGSGLHPPILNTNTSEIEHRAQELIIPKNYRRQNPHVDVNHTFRPSDASLTITKRAADEDLSIKYDFEDGSELDDYNAEDIQNVISTSYEGQRSLQIESKNALQGSEGNYGGAKFTMPALVDGQYYTFSVALKISSSNPKRIYFDVKDSGGALSNLSFSVLADNTWRVYTHKVALNSTPRGFCHIYLNSASQIFFIDQIQIYKDAEKKSIAFHTDSFQSFKFNIPLARQNISCVGHKYYLDRALQLPIKSTVTLDMLVDQDLSGNLLDNLRKDQEYDMSIDFSDTSGISAAKYRFFGAKLDSVSYASSIGSNKTATANFSISNDYDLGRNIIKAEGRGLFIVDYLVDDNMNILLADDGTPIADSFPHSF